VIITSGSSAEPAGLCQPEWRHEEREAPNGGVFLERRYQSVPTFSKALRVERGDGSAVHVIA